MFRVALCCVVHNDGMGDLCLSGMHLTDYETTIETTHLLPHAQHRGRLPAQQRALLLRRLGAPRARGADPGEEAVEDVAERDLDVEGEHPVARLVGDVRARHALLRVEVLQLLQEGAGPAVEARGPRGEVRRDARDVEHELEVRHQGAVAPVLVVVVVVVVVWWWWGQDQDKSRVHDACEGRG